jgi:hypothetical protein
MAIINPDGLFHGERLARCSDEAQLHWVRLFTASNTFGRIELSYRHIVNFAYSSFHKKPTEEQLAAWIQEYFQNYLLFVYDAEDGATWGQWLTSVEYLSRYHTAADRRSPEPDAKELELYRREYSASKSSKSLKINRFSKPFQTIPNHNTQPEQLKGYGEVSQDEIEMEADCLANLSAINDVLEPPELILDPVLGNGIGTGKGNGEGKGKKQNTSPKPKKKPDPRHTPFRELLGRYWKYVNPKNPEMPWGKPEAGQLGNLLAASPNLTAEQFHTLLSNRAKSDVAHGERVHIWLANITKFSVPLNEYGKPKNGNGGRNAAVPTGKTDHNMAICAELIAEDQYRSRANENGGVQASEAKQDGRATLFLDSGAAGHESVSGGNGYTF